MPPAFNLSQDQTLQFNLIANFLARKIKENNKYFLSCSASIWLSPSTHTYRLFCFLKSGAGRCVSFPSLRCLLRRRTIRPQPNLVNTLFSKYALFLQISSQSIDLKKNKNRNKLNVDVDTPSFTGQHRDFPAGKSCRMVKSANHFAVYTHFSFFCLLTTTPSRFLDRKRGSLSGKGGGERGIDGKAAELNAWSGGPALPGPVQAQQITLSAA